MIRVGLYASGRRLSHGSKEQGRREAMEVSTEELRLTQEVVEDLLEEMGLAAYLYEVEPAAGEWMVRVECALDGGWQAVQIPVAKETLLSARSDRRVRAELLEEWGGELAPCRRFGGQ